MRYRALDENGDMQFGAGLLNFYINTPQAVGQAVNTAILLWLGEWYQDTSDGTPFLQGVIGHFSQETADSVIQDRITSVDGVVSLDNYSSSVDPDSRLYTVSATITTIYGQTDVEINNVEF